MNEITPELIAAIATRLYNEIPGANLVPKTETDIPSSIPTAAELPSGVPALPAYGVSMPRSSGPGPDGVGEPDVAGFIPEGLSIPGVSGLGTTLPEVPGGAVVTPKSSSDPGAAGIYSQ